MVKDLFDQPGISKIHKMGHIGDAPYKCEVCGEEFHRPSTCMLQTHEMIHTGDTPYMCQVCGK